eukprot:CAMPEP_0117655548 /NCGR_PEP_ID=MMETSP0804-20121206/4336_1 /TAXON_ID=1074897 /ORGANISM="Tetraselmis astigmatica, Strain CCMP880" /LENGTH=35 /DNA_ID= /DNA_START= /DNA_END= /DNA_ORIENTATION=
MSPSLAHLLLDLQQPGVVLLETMVDAVQPGVEMRL